MAEADYRLLTEATGQRIAQAVENLINTAKVVRHTAIGTTNSAGVLFTGISINTIAWGFSTDTYPCTTGFYEGNWFLIVVNSANGVIVPWANQSVTYYYYTLEYGA